ncbi:glycosyltransferase family 2 protein [Fibrivirga algicola]|uniref:Glycosyltransferase family 2 protein n=1 Tax=Fibrivirga algicola TaxID=2950420 RepID=A0ABX0QHL4_9BACT|nr:glycosyltransferase family A protein [Fibrivirga algicola]NID11900.1 glycosyltransferase family 2 protein [Fibrivirga algicola]
MSSSPLVSIVIPVYNQKLSYFKDAVESALSQTYTNIEVVVSDNHSTNELIGYLASLTDERLKVRKPDQFLPMVQNFQFGADQATGNYLTFLCSDDYLCPDFVELMVGTLEANPAVAFGYSELACVEHYDLGIVRFNYHNKATGTRSAEESIRELLAVRPVLGFFPALMMRREGYTAIRHLLAGDIIFAFDIATVFSLHQLGDVYYLNKTLGKVRYWTSMDGKTSDDRFLEFVADTSKLCQLVEQLSILSPTDEGVKEWRRFQARRWLMVALFWSVRGDISVEKSTRGMRKINEEVYRYPFLTGLITWMLTKPQTLLIRPTLKGIIRLLLSLQRLTKKPL